MRPKLGMFCKSFSRDFERLQQLLKTYRRHNKDNMPFLLSLPAEEIALFKNIEDTSDLTVVADQDLVGFAQGDAGGWTYQQVVKLCCDQAGVADAFLCLDSDYYFCSDFSLSDFQDERGQVAVPISAFSNVISQTNPNLVDVTGYLAKGIYRDFSDDEWRSLRSGIIPGEEISLEELPTLVDGANLSRLFKRPHLFYAPMAGPILEARVLESMRERLLPHLTLKHPGHFANFLICYAPWEFFWYYEFLLASDLEFTRRPLPFVSFLSEADLALAGELGITQQNIIGNYTGISLAAGHFDALRLE